MLGPNDWESWKASPVTEAYFGLLRERWEDIQKHIGCGGCIRDDPAATALEYVKACGRASELEEALCIMPRWAERHTGERNHAP